MKRKLVIIFLLIISAVCVCIGLTACDNSSGETKSSASNNSTGSSEGSSENNDSVASSDNKTDITVEGITYTLNESFYEVTSIDDDITNVYILSEYNSMPVTSIASYAFYKNTSIKTVYIPSSITKMGSYAFYTCTALNGVYITDIAAWCEIEFSSYSNPLIYAHNLYLYDSSSAEYKNITELTIPDGVTTISSYAFYGCNKLTGVNFPDGLESIGYRAFYYCGSLTDIVIPDSVTSIGSGAFARCSKITSITLPFTGSSPKTSSDTYQYPFGYIFGTESYTGGTGISQWYYGSSISSTSYETYYVPSTLASVTFTGENILYGAFSGCAMLKSITIGENVKFIDDYAFYNCTNLTEVNYNAAAAYDLSHNTVWYYAGKNSNGIAINIGANVTKIPDYMFYSSGSPKFTSVTFEDNCICESIGKNAFSYNDQFTSITIPESIKSIGEYAFFKCTALTAIYFNAIAAYDLTSSDWCSSAGQNGDGLTLVIGAKVTAIPNYLFWTYSTTYAAKLTSIVFEGESVCASIGEYAFYCCTQLKTVSIPQSVTKIGASAFNGCNTLESISFESTNNWYITKSEGAAGTPIDVTDTGANVTLFTDTYKYYYWYRSEN